MKQKLNYSQYVDQEPNIFRYVENSELTWEILCHSDWIFPIYISVNNSIVPPFELWFVSSHLTVFESFPSCCWWILACSQSPIAFSIQCYVCYWSVAQWCWLRCSFTTCFCMHQFGANKQWKSTLLTILLSAFYSFTNLQIVFALLTFSKQKSVPFMSDILSITTSRRHPLTH